MPSAKAKQKKSKYNWWLVILFILVILFLASLSWLINNGRPAVKVHGTASLSEKQLRVLSDKDKYTNLDLRIAKLAVYKGAPLTVTKDLGVYGGVRQRIVSFPVYSSNLVEFGLMTLPRAAPPAGGYPVLILLHGYVNPPRYSTTKFYVTQMEYYSSHGYAVIKPDLRGQGLSKNAGRPEGAYFSMGYNVDVQSLLASVKDTSYLNANNINLWGHSMGAYVALRAAVLSPDVRRVILLSGPVGSLQQMYNTYIPISDRNNPVALLIKSTVLDRFGTPDSNPGYWDNASPINFLNQTKARYQIHVGQQDTVVPPVFSSQLDSALTKAKIPHEYYSYENGDHGLVLQMPQVLQRSLDFLNS